MNIIDPAQIYLASASASSEIRGHLQIFSMQELLRSKAQPLFVDNVSHLSPIKALRWNPIKNGMFVTGGSTLHDSVIRLYDINHLCKETLANNMESMVSHADVVHSVKCNSIISSLNWRKTKLTQGFGSHELISTHGEPDCEVKLWQINKYKQKESLEPLSINGKKVEYWFSKIKDFYCHNEQVIDSILSPDSSTLATLCADETLKFWKMFESYS